MSLSKRANAARGRWARRHAQINAVLWAIAILIAAGLACLAIQAVL